MNCKAGEIKQPQWRLMDVLKLDMVNLTEEDAKVRGRQMICYGSYRRKYPKEEEEGATISSGFI